MDWKKIIAYIVFTLMLVNVVPALSAAGDAAKNETDAFKKAYALIADEDWDEARDALTEFLNKFPESVYSDDAAYWYCYAKENSGEDLEDCYDCYEDFLDERKNSKWTKTVKKRMIILAKKLEKHGEHHYTTTIKSFEDNGDEVAVAAIHALGLRGGKDTAAKLMKIFNKKKSQKIRKAILFALSQDRSDKALDYLIEIAKSDVDDKTREEAVFWIGQRNEKKSRKLLSELVNGNYPMSLQKKAVFALSQHSGSMKELKDIALNHKSTKVREEAIFWIGQNGGKDELPFFEKLVFNNTNKGINKKAVFAISQLRGIEKVKVLKKVVKEHKNEDIQKEALFWIGQTGGEGILDYLKDLARNHSSKKIRKSAIFGISQNESKKKLDILIDLAENSKDTETRKEAIFWIGQSKSEKAYKFISKNIFSAKDEKTQKALLFGLYNMVNENKGGGLDLLIKVAKEHPNMAVRKQAVFWLGQTEDPKALKALEDMLNDI